MMKLGSELRVRQEGDDTHLLIADAREKYWCVSSYGLDLLTLALDTDGTSQIESLCEANQLTSEQVARDMAALVSDLVLNGVIDAPTLPSASASGSPESFMLGSMDRCETFGMPL